MARRQHPRPLLPIVARYHLDYLRPRGDIQRIRFGVWDYLTPQRKNPRDLAPMLGEYVGESDPS